MDQAISQTRPAYFEASMSDFRSQAKSLGWGFWRGIVVGFVAAFPLAYLAVAGETFFSLGA